MERQNLKGIGLQFFADGVDSAAENTAPSDETKPMDLVGAETVQDPAVETEKPKKSFTRDDVNKIVSAEVQKALAAAEERKTEAEKLAKMKDDERLRYEKEKSEKERDEAIAELNAYKLKDEAVKIAKESGLPVEFLELLNFRTLNAEQVSKNLESISGVFKSAVEAEVNKRLGQKAPGGGVSNDPAKKISRAAQLSAEYHRNLYGVPKED